MAKQEGIVYTLNEYECGYCGYKFRQYVRKIGGKDALGYNTNPQVSSQVKCGYCSNYLKTWEGCKEIEEVKAFKPIRNRVVEI